MMLNRIQSKVNPYLRPNQNGLRPRRTTTARICVCVCVCIYIYIWKTKN